MLPKREPDIILNLFRIINGGTIATIKKTESTIPPNVFELNNIAIIIKRALNKNHKGMKRNPSIAPFFQ